jgi:hypothetical protein
VRVGAGAQVKHMGVMVLVARFEAFSDQIPLAVTFSPRLKVSHVDPAFFLKKQDKEGLPLSFGGNAIGARRNWLNT